MPGVFAQIGMEYGHRYGGTSFELFARISEKNHAHSTLNPKAAEPGMALPQRLPRAEPLRHVPPPTARPERSAALALRRRQQRLYPSPLLLGEHLIT